MNTEAFEIYFEEIINQSELALAAIGELNFSVSNLNRLSNQSHQYHKFHKGAFHSIDVFLTHVGTISRMLWPETPQRGKNTQEADDKDICSNSENQITKNIKKRLGPGSRYLLKDRKLRDYFNEYMEHFGVKSIDKDNIICSFVTIAYTPLDKEICYYDPISRNFHFNGETYNIQDAATVIFKLLSYARHEHEKQRALARVEPINSRQSLQISRFVQKEVATPY